MTIAETLQQLPNRFNPAAAKGLNKTIQLNITGDEGGSWAVQIANQQCTLITGSAPKPDLTLTLSDKDWMALIERKLDPMNAFMTGKLKATGDLMLAPRIPSLFQM